MVAAVNESSLFAKLVNSCGLRALRTYRSSLEDATSAAAVAGGLASRRCDENQLQPWLPNGPAPHLSHGVFPLATTAVPCVVGKKQAAWITDADDYCHLCQAPLGDNSRSFHMGFDRDHVALNGFFCMTAMYPRTWNPGAAVTAAASLDKGQTPLLFSRGTSIARCLNHGVNGMMQMTHPLVMPVFSAEDERRVEELRAVLLYLACGPAPHRVIRDSLFDRSPPGMTGQGEKILRAPVTDLVAKALPALGPNIQAALSQKAWGRTNLMLLFDRLRLQEFQDEYGCAKKVDRSDKSSVLRQVAVELCMAQTAAGRDIDDVGKVLASLAVSRLAFEAVYQKTAQYQHHVFQVYAAYGYPSPRELLECDFL